MKPNDQKTSLWTKLMNSALQSTENPESHILVFGDAKSGKKTLINTLLAKMNQHNELIVSNEKSVLAEMKKRTEQHYIFDYKFIKVNKFEDDDFTELGKINFYCVNKKYPVSSLVFQRLNNAKND